MLNNISWASYLYAISIILVIYYASVLIIYYRNYLQNNWAQFRRRLNQMSTGVKAPSENKETNTSDDPDSDLQDTYLREVSLKIQSLLQTAATRNYPREELLLSLQLQLKKYRGEKYANYKEDISNYIIAACKDYCSIHLREEEVCALWIE